MFFFKVTVKISEALRPRTESQRQHKEIKFWHWGPTTIWHNRESVAFFSKSLHPTLQ